MLSQNLKLCHLNHLSGVITGHHYNRAVCILKIVYEEGASLHWKEFGEYVSEKDDLDIDLDFLKLHVHEWRDALTSNVLQLPLESETLDKSYLLYSQFLEDDRSPMYKL